MAEAGWLGITMPEAYGGAGLGVTEAAIMMHEVASHGGGIAAASTVHINLFGPHPIVVFGTPSRRRAGCRAWWRGRTSAASASPSPTPASTPPDQDLRQEGATAATSSTARRCGPPPAQVASKIMLLTRTTKLEDCKRPTDGITIFYTDLDRSKIEVQAHSQDGPQGGGFERHLHRQPVHPREDRIGEEGKGFGYILHSLNPERC
jgi:acyl-CoA dehydrogenase